MPSLHTGRLLVLDHLRIGDRGVQRLRRHLQLSLLLLQYVLDLRPHNRLHLRIRRQVLLRRNLELAELGLLRALAGHRTRVNCLFEIILIFALRAHFGLVVEADDVHLASHDCGRDSWLALVLLRLRDNGALAGGLVLTAALECLDHRGTAD